MKKFYIFVILALALIAVQPLYVHLVYEKLQDIFGPISSPADQAQVKRPVINANIGQPVQSEANP